VTNQRKGESREDYLARRRAEKQAPGAREKHREWARGYRERTRAERREGDFRTTYGISRSEADRLIAAQGGLCAACGYPPRDGGHCARLHVDHCHETGRVRGMLCNRCNTALGLMFEDPKAIQGLLQYLEDQP
jgi:hypothetical protein